MAQAAKFWDRMAERYSKSPVKDEESYQKKLEITRGYLHPESELLEFGCGTGSTAIVHAPHVKHIRAVDVSSKMLEIAQAKADAANITNITFEHAGMDDLSAPDGAYDVILGMSILHLLEDKEAAIAKVYKMLKPGGVFISSTVCIGEKMGFIRLIAPIGRALGLLPTLRIFTTQQLEDSVTAAGFETEHRWRPHEGMTLFLVARKPDPQS